MPSAAQKSNLSGNRFVKNICTQNILKTPDVSGLVFIHRTLLTPPFTSRQDVVTALFKTFDNQMTFLM
jgi:hypothetical protein